jgi:hypothetical protein
LVASPCLGRPWVCLGRRVNCCALPSPLSPFSWPLTCAAAALPLPSSPV